MGGCSRPDGLTRGLKTRATPPPSKKLRPLRQPFRLRPGLAVARLWRRLYLAPVPERYPFDLPDLLARCARREPAAQRALYGHYAARLLGVARRYANSLAEAEEILQDAFVKAFTSLATFRGEGSLEGWLRRIVVTTALNHWQANRPRRHQTPLDADDLPDPPDLGQGDALDHLAVQEVLALVQQLPDGCRLVLLLYAVDGYTHGEIAELLNIQESTSKAQLCKARKQLTRLYRAQNAYFVRDLGIRDLGT